MILLWFPIAECPMMLVASPLLQCHFRGTRAPIMPAILMADSFPISHNFPLFGAVSLKATCWLSISGCPWRVDFPFHLDSTFGCPFFLLFFPSEPNPPLPSQKFSQLLPLVVLLSRLPKVALKICPFMDFGLQIFWAYHPFLSWAQPLFNFTFHGVGPFLWALCHNFFRPQHLAPQARGLPAAHAWVI